MRNSLEDEGERSTLYIRSGEVAVIRHRTAIAVASLGHPAVLFTKRLAVLGELLEQLREPQSIEALARNLNLEIDNLRTILGALVRSGAIVEVSAPYEIVIRTQRAPICKRACVGVSGSIQAAAILPILLEIKSCSQEGVDVILTKAASHFVSIKALQALGFRVWRDDHTDMSAEVNVVHMHLAETADVVLVLPASAHTLQRLASGACSDLLSLVVAATCAPVIIGPAMNPRMWAYSPIKENIARLQKMGAFILEPGIGFTASEGGRKSYFAGVGVSVSLLDDVLKSALALAKLKPE